MHANVHGLASEVRTLRKHSISASVIMPSSYHIVN